MSRRAVPTLLVLSAVLLAPRGALAGGDACVDCHGKQSPGIVADWKLSKHAAAGVDCTGCHGEGHQSATDAARVPPAP